MKIKFNKNAFGYKANDEVEVTAEEAKVFGDNATEVKVSVEDLAGKAADELMANVDARISVAVDTAVAKAVSKIASKRHNIVVGPDNLVHDPKGGFKNFGEFAQSVRKSVVSGQVDERLRIKGGMDEGTPADGGYAVPTEYATEIFSILMGEDALLPRTRNYPTNTAKFDLPIDNLVTIGSNPIGANWINPDGTPIGVTGSGALNQLTFSLGKVATLVSVTDELLQDNNVLLDAFLTTKAGYAITYAVNQGIIQGTGTNQPTGIVGNAATVVVTAQGVDEYVAGPAFSYKDLTSMVAVFLKSNKPNPVWLLNKSEVGNLYNLKDDSGRNLYYAPGTIQQQPSGSLLGIPVVENFHMATPGSPGDIILADMGAYITVTKKTGIEAASSIHLYFNQDATAFRFTFRIDGKPGLVQPLKDPNFAVNGVKYSPFVTLSQRT